MTPQPASQPAPAVTSAPGSSADPPPRAQWHVEPMKVFDNLYYLGQSEYTAWAITTSAGIIVTDPLFDYSVEDEVVNGLTKLGLDPREIKYILVSHGHRDHVGGARLLQERYGARVIMSAADWDLVLGNQQPYPKPKRDMVAVDGQQLTLGDTSITMLSHPGSYAGNHFDTDPGEGSGPIAPGSPVGRNGIQLHDHPRPYEAILVRRLRSIGESLQRGRGKERRRRANRQSPEPGWRSGEAGRAREPKVW